MALLPTSVDMIHAKREPSDILLLFRIYWRYSTRKGQELKAHLSIEVSNGNATHDFIVVSNLNV